MASVERTGGFVIPIHFVVSIVAGLGGQKTGLLGTRKVNMGETDLGH